MAWGASSFVTDTRSRGAAIPGSNTGVEFQRCKFQGSRFVGGAVCPRKLRLLFPGSQVDACPNDIGTFHAGGSFGRHLGLLRYLGFPDNPRRAARSDFFGSCGSAVCALSIGGWRAKIPRSSSKTTISESANQTCSGSSPESFTTFVATSTSNRVAVLRTVPEMVMNASETRGYCAASESRRSLTLWSCSASCMIIFGCMGYTTFQRP